jgi:aldehyde:ferredoxin oxidoreductase
MDLCGRLLEIDLTSAAVRQRPLDPAMARSFLGGRGLNVALLDEALPGAVDPLSPDNLLVLACGLLTGTPAPASSRLHLNAVSPLTGLLGSANIGGHFGAWLRACGFQAVLIRGRSPRPVYLDISPEGARIRGAEALWGLDTHATEDRLAAAAGCKIQTLTIGPAGERLARFACIISDRDHAAGRTGLGAVMGAKRLKALVVRRPAAARRPPAAAVKGAVEDYLRQITGSPDFGIFSRLGGAGYVKWASDQRLMGARNYRRLDFPGAADLDGSRLQAAVVRSRGCARCPVQCKALLQFAGDPAPAYRPEFEPMINLGAKCGLGDGAAVVRLENLCTRLGLDSTSAGTAIAFAMDLSARGMMPAAKSGGLDLSWGNPRSMETLIRQMAAMEGLGGLLALGVRRAAREFGPRAAAFAAHVKGLELTAYHPAALLGSALGYAISSRGGDYNNVYASLEHRWSPRMAERAFGTAKALDPRSYEGKPQLVYRAVLVNIVVDSLGLCKVPALSLIGTFDLVGEARLTAAVTGWPVSARDLLQTGARVASRERRLNIRLGLRAADDSLPEMFFSGDGPRLDRERFAQMVREFYELAGWDAAGRPL